MAKLERMVKLARLKEEGADLTVRQMSQICGVSQRTIFRYLNTLDDMDLPGEMSRRIGVRRKAVGTEKLDADDISLVLYLLATNSIVAYPFFRRRLQKVRKHLKAIWSSVATESPSDLFQIKTGQPAREKTDQNRFLERFVKARSGSRQVKMGASGLKNSPLVLKPRGIKIVGQQILLVLVDPTRGQTLEIGLNRVHQLEICRASSAA